MRRLILFICLLFFITGCGDRSLTEQFKNDTGLLLKYLDEYTRIVEPKAYSIIDEIEVYGASGKHYYLSTSYSDNEIMFTSGVQKKKDCYFMFEAKDMLMGHLIYNDVIVTKEDSEFVKKTLAPLSIEVIENFFYKWMGVLCYVLTNEDIKMLDAENKLDSFREFKREWNAGEVSVENPIGKKNLKNTLIKIKGIK